MITAFKISIDGKSEGPQGFADWVDSWSDDYGLMEETDACIVGGRMYPGYETYWTAIRDEPGKPLPMSGKVPTKAELEWSRFAAKTSHYVLSRTLTAAKWANTSFLRDLNAVADLKKRDGKAIYLMGSARVATSLIDAGLLDEIRLIVYPLISGQGKALFGNIAERHGLKLKENKLLGGGRLLLSYLTVEP
jgi:dihydrofolate reductase